MMQIPEHLIPVPLPKKGAGLGPAWSQEEKDLIAAVYPWLEVSAEELIPYMPWRTKNAIHLQASRMGIKKESLLEHIKRRAAQ